MNRARAFGMACRLWFGGLLVGALYCAIQSLEYADAVRARNAVRATEWEQRARLTRAIVQEAMDAAVHSERSL
jgi:hypothetical protein